MGLVKFLKRIFNSGEKHHNARDFVEILRTDDRELANSMKGKLEKFKIPVYELDHQISSQASSGKIIFRIPRKFKKQADEILKINE